MPQASRASKNVIYKKAGKNTKTVQKKVASGMKKAAPKKPVAKKVAKKVVAKKRA